MHTIPVMQIASKVNSRDLGAFQTEDRRKQSFGDRQSPTSREQMKTQVTFDSEVFNTSQPVASHARPGNYGNDAARWLMTALQENGADVACGLGQDYHGWYFFFDLSGTKYEFTLRRKSGEWMGSLERSVGLVSTILGGRDRGISRNAIEVIDQVLRSKSGVSNVRWRDKAPV